MNINTNTAKEIKKAIEAIVKLAVAPYPTPQMEANREAALEYLNTLQPDAARAAIKLADTLIEGYFETDEDED
jgi:histidinol-phosphate/aromatic aminotransferase/cobyric acid decarboxylase-like protein